MWKYLFVYVYPQCNVGGLRGGLGGGGKGARYEGSKTGPKKKSEREKEKGRDTSTVRLGLCILHLSCAWTGQTFLTREESQVRIVMGEVGWTMFRPVPSCIGCLTGPPPLFPVDSLDLQTSTSPPLEEKRGEKRKDNRSALTKSDNGF